MINNKEKNPGSGVWYIMQVIMLNVVDFLDCRCYLYYCYSTSYDGDFYILNFWCFLVFSNALEYYHSYWYLCFLYPQQIVCNHI